LRGLGFICCSRRLDGHGLALYFGLRLIGMLFIWLCMP